MMSERKISVLVVDDEVDFRQLMSYWLQSKGYNVLEAADGIQAVELVHDKNPDIVFMDIRMPMMDGATTIKKIREFNTVVPIVVISAHVDDQKVKEAMPYGISGVFYKGGDFQEGLSLLEAALRTHKDLKNNQ